LLFWRPKHAQIEEAVNLQESLKISIFLEKPSVTIEKIA
jgi:hypothetical protein